jgi:Fe-S cluster assembly protein SufB
VLTGENAFSDFYSLSVTKGAQQADTGTRMIHLAPNTKSNIVSFGAALGKSKQTFRSLVRFLGAECANASKCESKIIGTSASANTIPVFSGTGGRYSHEAKTGTLDKNSMFYLNAAGLGDAEAAALLVAGIAGPVLERLPMEFLVESKQLIGLAMA